MEVLMKNRLSVITLVFIIAVTPVAQVVHAGQATATEQTARIKSQVGRRLKDRKERVKIKLRTGESVKGRIDQAGDDSFVVTEDKTNKRLEFTYGEVAKVEGRGLGKGTKIAIIAGIAIGVLAIVVAIGIHNFDPFEGGLGNVLH
jgi:tetrahydromethanopterin S-methyltransferase subunit G